jgi:hypothetical protein
MRRVDLFSVALALAAGAPAAAAQSGAVRPGDDIAVAVVVPPTMPGIEPAVQTQLESRLSQSLTGTGFAAVPGGSPLVMYPSLVVLNESVYEGPRNRTLVKLDLSLYLKNASDGVLFASTSRTLDGVGANRNAAILSAVSNLRGDDPAIRQFTASARARITEYYARNCDAVIADGRAQAGAGDVGRAMAVLLSVPRESAACHEKASEVAVGLYAQMQERECQTRLRTARGESAANHYVAAVDALEGIDPSSSCAREADQLLAQIAREVDRNAERALQTRLAELRGRRDAITRTLDTPARITTRRVSLAAEARIEWLNREPRPAYGPDLFK